VRKYEKTYAKVIRRPCISTHVTTHINSVNFTTLHCYNILSVQDGDENYPEL